MEAVPKYYTLFSIISVISVITYFCLHSEVDLESATSYRVSIADENQPAILHTDNQPEIAENLYKEFNRTKRKNVLFLISDDLRPQLGCYRGINAPNPYSKHRMYTPHLDALARRSLVLTNAYVQYSLCAPSRTSFLTGRRPDTTKVWDLVTYWRESGGNFTTLPQYFKDNGYVTVGTGKTFHGGTSAKHFDIPSWSIKYKRPKHASFWNMNHIKDTWKAVSKSERRHNPLPDEEIAAQAIGYMRSLSEDARSGKRNFFIAVGFHKPHLPWVFPEEFLDLYPMHDMEVPGNKFLPWKMPDCGFTSIHEFPLFNDVKRLKLASTPNVTYPDKFTKVLRRAYFACVSYIDSLVGKILKEVDDLGLADNTVVSFLGDHGFHLAENGHWGKHTNFEQGTRAPLMIHIPGRTERGIMSNSLVEFVDIYPTIVEAAGLSSIPPCPRVSRDVLVCTEGESFLPLIDYPETQLKDAAYSQMPRTGSMGYSLRTNRYRYTEWLPLKSTKQTGEHFSYRIMWDDVCGVELYDHKLDPEEVYNRADDDSLQDLRRQFTAKLRDFVGNTIENATVRLA